MSEQFWWHVARASGIVAWLALTALVLWGIVLATDLFPEHRRPAWLLAVHRWLGALTVGFMGAHVAALMADSFVSFGPADVLVPFASDWKPGAVALGVFALWGVIAVEASSLAKRRLSRRTWRLLHLLSYPTYWLACLHGTFAGTDATSGLYVGTSIATIGAVVFAALYRVLQPKRRTQVITAPPIDRTGEPVRLPARSHR